jgi:hypothetical protein
MKRTEVTFGEFESGNITEKVASLDEIRGGEGFICVRKNNVDGNHHSWPVWEKTEKGLLRQRKKEGTGVISEVEDFDFFRVKE